MGIDRARTALEYIKTHPDEWDQTVWICGTAACLAGHIVLNAGADPIESDPDSIRVHSVSYGGHMLMIADLARRLLGITAAEAGHLFAPRNGLSALEYHVGMLENDLLPCHPDHMQDGDFEHEWIDLDGIVNVFAHRRTVGVIDNGDWTETHHANRTAARDYASDVASCRTLTYRNNNVWSTLA